MSVPGRCINITASLSTKFVDADDFVVVAVAVAAFVVDHDDADDTMKSATDHATCTALKLMLRFVLLTC